MKSRLIAVWSAALLLPSLLTQAPAFAQQGPAMQGRGWAQMMGSHQGMMGGGGMMWGCGPGMMGAEYSTLNLTKDQRNQIYAIHRDLRTKQFALMDRMHADMQSAMSYRDGKFDEQAARQTYLAAEKIHRQMFDNMLDAQKKVDTLLTPQQRQQLSQARQ